MRANFSAAFYRVQLTNMGSTVILHICLSVFCTGDTITDYQFTSTSDGLQ